jgi:hypothetical protein
MGEADDQVLRNGIAEGIMSLYNLDQAQALKIISDYNLTNVNDIPAEKLTEIDDVVKTALNGVN